MVAVTPLTPGNRTRFGRTGCDVANAATVKNCRLGGRHCSPSVGCLGMRRQNRLVGGRPVPRILALHTGRVVTMVMVRSNVWAGPFDGCQL
jgi:hypothetical protein